MRNLTPKTP